MTPRKVTTTITCQASLRLLEYGGVGLPHAVILDLENFAFFSWRNGRASIIVGEYRYVKDARVALTAFRRQLKKGEPLIGPPLFSSRKP